MSKGHYYRQTKTTNIGIEQTRLTLAAHPMRYSQAGYHETIHN